MRPLYHPHPNHFYRDAHGITHSCNGDQMIPGNVGTYLVWTLCGSKDVPSDQSFMSNQIIADCPECLIKEQQKEKE
jgi:hypothetical protein